MWNPNTIDPPLDIYKHGKACSKCFHFIDVSEADDAGLLWEAVDDDYEIACYCCDICKDKREGERYDIRAKIGEE